jgi:hypothetical protein
MTLRPDRRFLLAGLAALGVTAASPPRGRTRGGRVPGIAVTIDDFDLSDIALMNGEERDTARSPFRISRPRSNKLLSVARASPWSPRGSLLGRGHYGFVGKRQNRYLPGFLLSITVRLSGAKQRAARNSSNSVGFWQVMCSCPGQ